VGVLFAGEGSQLPKVFSTTFRQWLDRFQDCDVGIRKCMLEAASDILCNNENEDILQAVRNGLKTRLRDPDKEVRRKAVQCVCEVAAHGWNNVSDELIREVGERCSDKVAIIRREAVTGLAQVYKHVLAAGAQAPQGDSEEEEDDDDKINLDGRLARVGWIPAHVLITFNINDSELKCRILQLLDEILLPKNFSPIDRADRLIHIFSQLTENAKIVLRRIFSTRRSVQRIVHNFASDRNDTQAVCVFQKFALTLKNVEVAHVESLRGNNDKKVFQLLQNLASPGAIMTKNRKLRIELLRRIGSKSPQAAMMKKVLRYASMTTLDVESVQHVYDVAFSGHNSNVSKKKSNRKKLISHRKLDKVAQQAAVKLLLIFATYFPSADHG
jgi:hypothetical protein